MLAIMRTATHLLSPEEMGRMFLITTITAFFTVLLIYHVGMFINRRLHTWNAHGQVKHYLNYYWGYLLLVSAVAAACLAAINAIGVVRFQTDIAWLLALVCGSLLFNTANQTLVPSLNLLEFRGWFISLTLLTIISGFLFSLLLVLYFEPRAEYWLLGQLIGQTLLAFAGGKVLFDRVSNPDSEIKVSSGHIRALFLFAWPIAISVGLNWVQTQGYRFLMESMAGLSALGLFAAGYSVSAGLIAAVETILATYFQPRFYKRISDGTRDGESAGWNEYARVMLPALVLTGIFIAILAPEIARLLLGPAFQSASVYISWAAGVEVLRATAGIFGLVAHARMKTRLLLLPYAIGASVAILLVWLLLPGFGPVGAGAALVAAGIFTLVSMYLLMRGQLAMSLAPQRLFLTLLFGGGLLAAAWALRSFMGTGESLWQVLLTLTATGLVFMAMQLALLRPSLRVDGEAR